MVKFDAVLEVTQGQSFFQRAYQGRGFITACVISMAVHCLLQATAFVSTGTSHLKTRHNQIFYTEESSQAAIPMRKVTLSSRAETCEVITHFYKSGDITVKRKISVVTPERGYWFLLEAGYFCIYIQVKRN